MKKRIYGATKSGLRNTLENKFKSAGCKSVDVYDISNNHCKVDLTLPSGKATTITVWYDSHDVNNGKRTKTVKVPWRDTFEVDAEGNVYDNDEFVGVATVFTSDGTQQSTRKSYILKTIRTDSGDVIIDHPQRANNYSTVVQTLETRKVYHRS